MARSSGWILDVSVEQNRSNIWIKTTQGSILKLTDTYQPNFYILPKDENAGAALVQILTQESMVRNVEWDYKFTDLFDAHSHGLKRLISVYPESILSHNILVKRLENDTRVARLFNTDLSHIQRYLFSKLRIEPTSKVEVEYEDDNAKLRRITAINDFEVVPPPFSVLYFDVHNSDTDQINLIKARHQGEPEVHFEGDEENVLEQFHDHVVDKGPDIIVSTNQRFESATVERLFKELEARRLDLGRASSLHYHARVNRINGRAYLHNVSFHRDLDLVGLIERARFGFLPLSLAARYGMIRLIDSRNCYTLIHRGFVIPSRGSNKNNEPIRTLENINSKDKGGMIFSPRVGLHESVVVLDYENEYANLILQQNLSYEIVHSTTRDDEERGLLPIVLDGVLRRRIFFKNLQQSLPSNGDEWFWCEQRINALKSILVSLYGTTGSVWNRFANVLTFEEVNRLSREVLIKTKDIVQAHGFELLYADTDSVFLKKDGASVEDFEGLKDILAKETGLPISLEQYYRFLVLLPLEASEKIETLKHYYGITLSGELITRGIELRRHDAPNFIKKFQTELLYTLFDRKDSGEVMSKGYENALLLLTKTIDKVVTGDIELRDLVISKSLGQDIDKYKFLFPHVSAAIQLAIEGKSAEVGEDLEYVFTNARNTNPLCRVTPRALMEQTIEFEYDKEKYRELLLEAAETVLGYFGFDRTAFGDPPRKNKKWWQRLNEERLRDLDTERI